MSVWLNVAVVIVLILIEGLFVAAELSLVSLREGQVRVLAGQGRRGQRVAKARRQPQPVPRRGAARCHAHRAAVQRLRRHHAVGRGR